MGFLIREEKKKKINHLKEHSWMLKVTKFKYIFKMTLSYKERKQGP